MGFIQDRQPAREPSAGTVIPANAPLNFKRAATSPGMKGAVAIDLVRQAADVLQGIEDSAAQTSARAQQLAGQAIEQLKSSEARIRALEAAQDATGTNLQEAVTRADQMELLARRTGAQLTAIEDQLAAAEKRAGDAEARSAELEGILAQVEDAIKIQLLLNRQQPPARSAQAA